MKKYIGIDYGQQRIGLARADSVSMLACPWRTVAPAELVDALKSEAPFEAVVVGLPRSLDGAETPQTLAVRRFCDDVLWRLLKVDAIFQDEAGTSWVAEDRLKASGKPYTKADIDAEAASIILQDYIDQL